MTMLTIEAQVVGESVVLLQAPTLATNTVETVQVFFRFDNNWTGFQKTAMFWGTDDEEYAVDVVDDCAIVPREVMAEAGKIKFGVNGTDGDKLIVSEKVTYRILEGAYSVNGN